MISYDFKAIGTAWHIDIYQELGAAREAELFSRIRARIEAFEQAYSRFRDDSIVGRIARAAGEYELPSDAERMLALYRDLYDRTGGFFTPLIGGLLVDAGYDARYSLKPQRDMRAIPAWDDSIEYRCPILQVKKPVQLDFGAAGKGYLIDLVGELMHSEGVDGYCIDAGGDILHKGRTPIRIGLEDPQDPESVVGIYELKDMSICGSAGNRRAWGDFTHIMNPKTLSSPKEISAVWVVAQSALVADALTTCLFFVPAHALADAYAFEYLIVRADRSIERSRGFAAELFDTSGV